MVEMSCFAAIATCFATSGCMNMNAPGVGITGDGEHRSSGGALGGAGRLYLHPHGIEARCGYGNEEDLLMSQVERTPDAAQGPSGRVEANGAR